MPRRIWNLLCHEPLAQFVLGGGLIFLVYSLGSSPSRETIAISQETIKAILAQRAESLGRPLSTSERSAAVSEIVDEEMLVREAYKQGVDQNDAVVRSRLAEKMRFLLTGEPLVPTKEQLQAYMEANRDRFATPPRVTFDQVFFDSKSTRELPTILTALREGADFATLGDRAPLGATVEGLSEEQLAGSFGASFAHRVFGLQGGQWIGPVESVHGTHFIRAKAIETARLPPLEDVSSVVRTQWVASQREETLRRSLDELRKRYNIQLPIGTSD
jgi:parvulin-like peptidyl-prolyl isomerase